MNRPDDVASFAEPRGGTAVVATELRGSVWLCTIRLADDSEVVSMRQLLEPVELEPGEKSSWCQVANRYLSLRIRRDRVDDGGFDEP